MNTERETILRQLAEYDYPVWCEWVCMDYDVWPCSKEPVLMESNTSWKVHPIKAIFNDKDKVPKWVRFNKTFKFTISEINQAKEEVRADLKNIDNAMHEALKDDTELLSTGSTKDWYNREVKEYYDKILNVNRANKKTTGDKVTDKIFEILGIDWAEGCGPEKQNDWVQDNINNMFPDNGKPYQCKQMLVEGVLSNPCSCKQEFGTVEELKAHLIEKKVVADGYVPTTILNLFKK